MTNRPAPKPESAAPATSVAAPAPQGTLADKKLRVLIFGHHARDLENQVLACAKQGHEAIGALVMNPARRTTFTDGDCKLSSGAKPLTYSAYSVENAKKIIDSVQPHVVMTNSVYCGGQGRTQEEIDFAFFANREIPATFPASIPHLVKTAMDGVIIHAQDGKEGKDVVNRNINLNAFLKAEAEKLNAKGHAQG